MTLHLGSRTELENLSCDAKGADSDEVAWAILDDLARGYEMMSPGFGASLARVFLGWLGGRQ